MAIAHKTTGPTFPRYLLILRALPFGAAKQPIPRLDSLTNVNKRSILSTSKHSFELQTT